MAKRYEKVEYRPLPFKKERTLKSTVQSPPTLFRGFFEPLSIFHLENLIMIDTTYEANTILTIRKWFYEAAENAPKSISNHVTALSNQAGELVSVLDQYVNRFYTPITRAEVSVYAQQMKNALEPLFIEMKAACKAIKQSGMDNAPYLEAFEQYKSAVNGFVKIKEKDAKQKLPQNT